jgi:hypothetical protein
MDGVPPLNFTVRPTTASPLAERDHSLPKWPLISFRHASPYVLTHFSILQGAGQTGAELNLHRIYFGDPRKIAVFQEHRWTPL